MGDLNTGPANKDKNITAEFEGGNMSVHWLKLIKTLQKCRYVWAENIVPAIHVVE